MLFHNENFNTKNDKLLSLTDMEYFIGMFKGFDKNVIPNYKKHLHKM